jgi:hypothetical protein
MFMHCASIIPCSSSDAHKTLHCIYRGTETMKYEAAAIDHYIDRNHTNYTCYMLSWR